MRAGAQEETDEDLLARAAADPAALEEVYRRHVGALTRYATRRLQDPVEAADVVAGVFLEVIGSAQQYDRHRGKPRSWLFGIASNLIAAHARSRGVEARALERVYGQRRLDPDDYAELDARIDATRQSPQLRAAVQALSPAEYELFALVAHDGLSPTEAGAVLGVAAAAARMRLTRARRKLRHALSQTGPAMEFSELREGQW